MMNQLFNSLIVTLAVLVSAGLGRTALADLILVDDDFESYASGSDIHLQGPQPTGGTNEEWRTNNEQGTPTGTDNIITLGGGGQAYNLTSPTSGTTTGTHDPYLSRRFAPQAVGGSGSDILRFSTKVRHNALSSPPFVFPANHLILGEGRSSNPLSTDFTKTANDRAVDLEMKPNSNNQGFRLGSDSLIGTIIEGDWYEIIIDLDLDAQEFDISIDNLADATLNQHATRSGVTFANSSVTNLDTLAFTIPRFLNSTGQGNFDIDDVYLASIVSSVPEPSSFAFFALFGVLVHTGKKRRRSAD